MVKFLRFTLLELVIAIGLMGMMISMVSMLLYSLVQEWSAIENQARILREYQAVDRLVESAFRNAFTMRWVWPGTETSSSDGSSSTEERDPPLLFSGEADRVYLTYRHPAAGQPPASIRYLQIYVENRQLIAAYRNTPVLPDALRSEQRNIIKEILVNDVEHVEFLYAYRDYSSGSVNWLSNWETDAQEIPIAIQMKLTFSDGKVEVWLRRTASNGFAESYDIREDEYERENKPLEGIAVRKEDRNKGSGSGGGGGSSGGGGNRGGGGGNNSGGGGRQ